jgi:hypothetical protein
VISTNGTPASTSRRREGFGLRRAGEDTLAATRAAGVPARSVELDSPHGHDAFLIEHDQVGIPLSAFLDDVETL